MNINHNEKKNLTHYMGNHHLVKPELVTSAEFPPTCACQNQVDPQFKHFSRDIDRFQALFKTVSTLSNAPHFYSVRSVYLQS